MSRNISVPVDDFDDDDLDDDKIPAGLRAAARRSKEAAAENAALKRQLLFSRVGLHADDIYDAKGQVKPGQRVAAMLYQTFDGDIDELREQVTELGLATSTPPAPTNTAKPGTQTPGDDDGDDVTGQQAHRRALAGGDAVGTDVETPDPMTVALTTFQKDKLTMPKSEAAMKAIGTVMAAGAAGDRRVIFDPQAHFAAAQSVGRRETR